MGQLFFLGKLLMIFESQDLGCKLAILNIMSKIIKHPLVNENFQKMKGFSTVFNEAKKSNNQKVKILTLHCFNEMIQNPNNFFYFKAHGVVNYLEENLRFISRGFSIILKNFCYSSSQTYLEILLIIKIYSSLIMDDDLSIQIVEKSLTTIAKTLLDCHPCNRQRLQWDDPNSGKNEELILDLESHCFRLLRYLFNVKKNKNLFKLLFPSKIFVNFLDIGSFVKEVEKYRFLSNAFNQLTVINRFFLRIFVNVLKSRPKK